MNLEGWRSGFGMVPLNMLKPELCFQNARNHLVLEDICNLVRIRARKKLIGSLGRIALLGSYRIWLARYSQEWSGGELIR